MESYQESHENPSTCKSGHTNQNYRVDIMSSVEVTKQIHKDIDQPLKNLSINHQETVLKETHNIIESLGTIEKISKNKAQAIKSS